MAGKTIQQLSEVSSLTAGDQLVVWKTDSGATYKASLTALLSFFEENFTSPEFTEVLNVPVEGFSYTLADYTTNVWLTLNPASGLTSGTVILPSEPVSGQQVLITLTQSLDTFGVSAANTIATKPTRITSGGGSVLFRYDSTREAWALVSTGIPRGLIHSSGVTFGVGGNGTLTMDSQGVVTLNGGGALSLLTSVLVQTPVAIGSLPAASSFPGGRAFVNNHTGAVAFNGTPTAGGSTVLPVYSNGTNWMIG